MYNNPFKYRDPITEAVTAITDDGNIRRQAEMFVNEAYEIVSPTALCREDRQAYDNDVENVYKQLKEGVQLDEISKKLLGRYIRKVPDSLHYINNKTMNLSDRANIQHDETQRSKLDKAADKSEDKYLNRKKYFNKAVSRLTKEDVQLDEISGKTLGNYVNKAHKDTNELIPAIDNLQNRPEPLYTKNEKTRERKLIKKFSNRNAGINKAIRKMNKLMTSEDVQTEGYVSDRKAMTVTKGDSKTEGDFEKVKNAIKGYNKAKGTHFRYDKVGRLGKDNPNASKYADRWSKAYKAGGKLSKAKIRQDDSTRSDVYVRPRGYDYDQKDFGYEASKSHIDKILHGIRNKLAKKKMEEGYASVGRPFDKFGDVSTTAKFYGNKPKPTKPGASEPGAGDTYKGSSSARRSRLAKPVKEETINELSKGLLNRYAHKAEDNLDVARYDRDEGVKGASKTVRKRKKGIDLALMKMKTPEPKPKVYATEEETINELSKELLGRYVKKSRVDQEKGKNAGRYWKDYIKKPKVPGSAPVSAKDAMRLSGNAYRKAENRKVGFDRAVDKLSGTAKVHAKEETINEIVTKDQLAKSGLTLGQFMNKQRGLTAVKGGANDPTSSNFRGPKAPGVPNVPSPAPTQQTGAKPDNFLNKGVNVAAQTDTAAKSSIDQSKPVSDRNVPQPNTIPLPPKKPDGLKESVTGVTVGDRTYRIV
jgi:hypothetical protein